MLTYVQVHLYYLVPPIVVLLAVYHPLLGRRDGLSILWLCFMATIWTTPWDNVSSITLQPVPEPGFAILIWIISQSGWGYPPNSIVGKIFHVPIEEHMFFILQPIFLLLLHSLISHPRLLPFDRHDATRSLRTTASAPYAAGDGKEGAMVSEPSQRVENEDEVITLARRPLAALSWGAIWLFGLVLVNEAHGGALWNAEGWIPPILQIGGKGFYLGWILVWVSPVIALLTYLGARFGTAERLTFILGAGWLVAIDTIAIRAGAWYISPETSLGFHVWRDLPLEEFLFFCLTTHLILLSSSLISHLHTLLLLYPTLPPCPPLNPAKHIALLFRVALSPPPIDRRMLDALVSAQETLRKGSKSFDVAKLAFGREMRIGLVAIYAWCRVTDNLIDEAADCKDSESPSRLDILQTIRKHLEQAYSCTNPARGASPSSSSPSVAEDILCSIPDLSEEDRSAFHLFAALIPRLVPIHPFRELCDGYETDLRFVPLPSPAPPPSTARSRDTNDNGQVDVNVNVTVGVLPTSPLVELVQDPDFQLEEHLPIKTTSDLLDYADNVAGSIASAICYLSWSMLTPSPTPSRPVDSLSWTTHTHTHVHAGGTDTGMTVPEPESDPTPLVLRRMRITSHAREMGRALQLVNIARDIAKDARIGRVYVPLSSFSSAKDLLAVILPSSRSNPGPAHGSARESTRVDLDYAPYTLPLLEMADQRRSNSQHAMADLPRTARGGTRAMVASYFEIAEAIRRRGGAIDERGVKVDKWRRLLAAGTAMWFGMA